jgi:GNAT superfamily N-acetyltransferase
MSADPTIRLSTPADRDVILAFIERMGFTPRDAMTWDNLNMLAMTAWHSDQLIGAIPLEPRELYISPDKTIRVVHETAVAVEESFRNSGVGSKMQTAIAENPPMGAECVTVFREDPQTPAYRWYLRCGFFPLMHIAYWTSRNLLDRASNVELWPADSDSVPWDDFDAARSPGRVIRGLRHWLSIHPYRKQYQFWIIRDESNSVALLGAGTLHSKQMRADILDFVISDSGKMESLLRAVSSIAVRKSWPIVRVPMAEHDPGIPVVRALGFEVGWTFDMLGKSLSSEIDLSAAHFSAWRYAGVEFI